LHNAEEHTLKNETGPMSEHIHDPVDNHPTPTPGERIRATLEAQSQRQTRAKNQIAERLAQLADTATDFSVEELWRDLRLLNPTIGRATVFRAVELLVAAGLLNRIDFADGTHTFRACGAEHHHHLTCVQCHRVVDVDICIPHDVLDRIGQQTAFRIQGHSLTLFGLCEECQRETP
jgi:Fur family transcriptional regulator, ferric uptake regulator